MTALDLWADANYNKMTSEKDALVFWICLFALNQHDVAEEVGENPRQGPFNAALAQATGGAVMVLDDEVKPFSRIWCLFEVSRLKDLQRPFELICSKGSLSQPENGGHQVSTKMLEATCRALWNMSAAKAESSVAKDLYQIWAETANESYRHVIQGVGAERWWFNWFIDRHGADELAGVFRNFDLYMKSLLSTAMLKILMARGDYASASRCCLQGADVSSEQLTQICSSYAAASERRGWLNSMLLQTTNASMAKLLLEHGADVATADNDGGTALMWAAQGGHEAVAQLLLQHGADVAAAKHNGSTPLMMAAAGGHEAVAQLLLQHGADVAAAKHNGSTALMMAAAGGHEAVAQLLLQHGADVTAAMHDGRTALTLAAQGGHEAVAQLLLQHGADVATADNDGGTALMLAARGGHEAVAQLLLQHGADVAAAEDDGFTALMCAAVDGHEAVAQLLLQHGADVRAARHDGFTALMCAAGGGHEAVAQLLLQHGADARAAMHDGRTALMIARLNRHEAVARLLRKHGGDKRWFRRCLFG